MDGPHPPRRVGRRMGSPDGAAVRRGVPGVSRGTPGRAAPESAHGHSRGGGRGGPHGHRCRCLRAVRQRQRERNPGRRTSRRRTDRAASAARAVPRGRAARAVPVAPAARAIPSAGPAGRAVRRPRPASRRNRRSRPSGTVTDSLDGISFTVPSDWYGQAMQGGAQVSSNDTYKCPGDTTQTCSTGGAYSTAAVVLGTASTARPRRSPRRTSPPRPNSSTAARSTAASPPTRSSPRRPSPWPGRRATWSAGRRSPARAPTAMSSRSRSRHAASAGQIVVVRFGVDVGQKQSVIDEITSGIKVASGTGGDGQKI